MSGLSPAFKSDFAFYGMMLGGGILGYVALGGMIGLADQLL
jgi:hypothetical protein